MCKNKTCSKCKNEYPATDVYFKNHRGRPDGLNGWCKKCTGKSEKERRAKMDWVDKLIKTTKYSNRSRGNRKILSYTIDRESILKIFNEQNGVCHYSGIKLDVNKKCKFRAISCDRIDNSIGYEPDNIVLCCRFFNLGRCDGGFNEFKEFLKEDILRK